MPGKTLFGRYEVLKEIPTGGMSDAFCVRDTSTGALQFLKRVRPGRSVDFAALQRELTIYERVDRAGVGEVLAFLNWERDHDSLAIVTEWADGGDLEQFVRSAGGSLEEIEVRPIAFEILRGLAGLHAVEIVHRDIKPSNTLRVQGRWKLGDFGIAKLSARLPSVRTFQGHRTEQYAAPEQVLGTPAAPSADMYSFGRVCAFMLTGSPDGRHPGWGPLIDSCRQKDPSKRWTADAALDWLTMHA